LIAFLRAMLESLILPEAKIMPGESRSLIFESRRTSCMFLVTPVIMVMFKVLEN
jgi:hypothetical protein